MAACDWTIDTTCCPDWLTYSAEVRADAQAWAMDLLDRLTAFQFQQCPVTVRPCSSKCTGFTGYMTWPVGAPGSNGSGWPWMIPFVDNGIWRNCGCGGGCSCEARCQISLGRLTVSVTEITIDGLTLDPTAYRLDQLPGHGSVLVRTDGECWPECQDMNVTEGVGVFTVTYVPGLPLPAAGSIALGKLACEYAKSCVGGDCKLPAELASMTRNGVDVQIIDQALLPDQILTGLAEVDRWVRAVNPSNLRSRPRVLTPDIRRNRIVSP